MNRTLLDECFRIAGRTTWYTDITGIQRELDVFIGKHDLRRSHQGYRLMGRTTAQALRDALGIGALPPLDFTRKEEPDSELPPAA